MRRPAAWLRVVALAAVCLSPKTQAANGADVEKMMLASFEELMSQSSSIATQTPLPREWVPAAVTVVTAEDIAATGATNLAEILQGVPGLHVRINQFGFRPLVSVRGAAPKNALILVNGAPQRDLVWATGIFWRGLPASMIERIEIIRGPGSALYGSDASSGVINVITRTAGHIGDSEAGVRIGSFDTQTAWLRHGTRWGGYDIGLTLEAMRTDGHRPFIRADRRSLAGQSSHAPGRAEFGYDNLDLRLSVSRDRWRLLFDHMAKDDVRIGITGASNLDPRTRAWERQTSLAWLYANPEFAADWQLDAELRLRDLEYSSGTGFWEDPDTLNQQGLGERRYNAEIAWGYTGIADHRLRFGAGYVWQDIRFSRPATFVPQRVRRNAYVFVQDAWHFAENWELTAGGRYDRFSEVGSVFNPRVALVWKTTPAFTVKLMVGNAFRAPSFLELYALTGATNPNPDLRPERATTRELSFNWRAGHDLNLGLALFDYLQKNPIVDAGGTFRNVDSHRIRGIELEAVWQASRVLRLSGNVAWRARDDEQFSRLRVPDHFAIPTKSAYLRADWTFRPKWHLNVQANWSGRRFVAANDTRTPLGAQTVVNATLRHYLSSEWEFAASIRNLFDADAREYTGTRIPDYLPLPRRNAWAELRYKF